MNISLESNWTELTRSISCFCLMRTSQLLLIFKLFEYISKTNYSGWELAYLNAFSFYQNLYEHIMNDYLSNLGNRALRVFISSTFKNLKEERTYLSNKVFPSLRLYCQQKNCILVEQDLRWGITKLDSLSGKTVELCMESIKKSRPFFIGIIGERYGWIPDISDIADRDAFKEQYGAVYDYAQERKSITEMEFLYGALVSTEDTEAAFFIKNTSSVSDESIEHKQKIESLKKRIIEQKRFPVFSFSSVEELGTKVSDYVKDIVKKRFPDELLSSSELIDRKIELFKNRFLSTYVARKEPEQNLRDFLNDEYIQYAILNGVAGSGKTALLCNLYEELHNNEKYRVVFCAIGITESMSSKFGIADYLYDKLRQISGKTNRISFDGIDDNIISQLLSEALFSIENPDNVLIILDGIDALSIRDNSYQLRWLPKMPSGIKIIFSTRDINNQGLYYYSVRGTDYLLAINSQISTDKLSPDEIIGISKRYLGLYGKNLEDDQYNTIGKCSSASRAAMLRFLLDELRYQGSRVDMYNHLQKTTEVSSENELLGVVLDHIGKELSDQNTIKDIFCYLESSRFGLTEKEILRLTGITGLDWSVFLSLSQSALSCEGELVSISDWIHEYITEHFDINPDSLIEYRKKILFLFTDAEKNGLSEDRASIETPWQFLNIGDFQSLSDYASDIQVFKQWYDKDPIALSECLLYWKPLLLNGFDIDVFNSITISHENVDTLYHLSLFCKDNELFQSQRHLLELVYDYYSSVEMDEKERLGYIGNLNRELANNCDQLGLHKEATERFDKALVAFNAYGLPSILDRALLLTDYGLMFYRLEDSNKAIEKFKSAEDLFKEMIDLNLDLNYILPSLGLLYSDLALAYLSDNSAKSQSLNYVKKADKLAQEILKLDPQGNAENMLRIEKTVIGILLKLDKVSEAKRILSYTESVFNERSVSVPHRMAADYGEVLSNLATVILLKEKKEKEAKQYFEHAVELFEQYYAMTGQTVTNRMAFGATAFYYLGTIYSNEHDHDKALDYYSSSLYLTTHIFPYNSQIRLLLIIVVTHFVDLATATNNKVDALNLITKQIIELEDSVKGNRQASVSLVPTLQYLGKIYQEMGVLQNAHHFHTEIAHILREELNPQNLQSLIEYYCNLGELAFDSFLMNNDSLTEKIYRIIANGRTESLVSCKDIRLCHTYIATAEFLLGKPTTKEQLADYTQLLLLSCFYLYEQNESFDITSPITACYSYVQTLDLSFMSQSEKESLYYELVFILSLAKDNKKKISDAVLQMINSLQALFSTLSQ